MNNQQTTECNEYKTNLDVLSMLEDFSKNLKLTTKEKYTSFQVYLAILCVSHDIPKNILMESMGLIYDNIQEIHKNKKE